MVVAKAAELGVAVHVWLENVRIRNGLVIKPALLDGTCLEGPALGLSPSRRGVFAGVKRRSSVNPRSSSTNAVKLG